jgi:hypothetical protein
MKRLPILFLAASAFIFSCTNGNKYDIKATDKYENSKVTLSETEQKFPDKFINATCSDKKNLLGQTVVKGSLHNNAKVVAYKDVELKLSFYSKTGALLEEDHETVYETVQPGTNASFKTKLFTPKGTDSVAIKVVSAKF